MKTEDQIYAQMKHIMDLRDDAQLRSIKDESNKTHWESLVNKYEGKYLALQWVVEEGF